MRLSPGELTYRRSLSNLVDKINDLEANDCNETPIVAHGANRWMDGCLQSSVGFQLAGKGGRDSDILKLL